MSPANNKAWLRAVNAAVRQSEGSIAHLTSHPSSSFSKETAQSDSDLVMVLAKSLFSYFKNA